LAKFPQPIQDLVAVRITQSKQDNSQIKKHALEVTNLGAIPIKCVKAGFEDFSPPQLYKFNRDNELWRTLRSGIERLARHAQLA
jgi:hypothetical protein